MTKLEKELMELTSVELVDRFDSVSMRLTHEVNSTRGQTKKTTNEFDKTRAELIRRLEG